MGTCYCSFSWQPMQSRNYLAVRVLSVLKNILIHGDFRSTDIYVVPRLWTLRIVGSHQYWSSQWLRHGSVILSQISSWNFQLREAVRTILPSPWGGLSLGIRKTKMYSFGFVNTLAKLHCCSWINRHKTWIHEHFERTKKLRKKTLYIIKQ